MRVLPVSALIACALACPSRALAQAPAARGSVQLTRIADSVWVHTSSRTIGGTPTPSNGLVVRTRGGGMILVDTAWDDGQTQELLRVARQQIGSDVRLALITHAHDDRIGGIRALRAARIRVVATDRTGKLAVAQGLPAPDPAPRNPATFTIDSTTIEFYFPGPGHSPDNAVVWVPGARVLFGGCLLKAMEATTKGNVADADLAAWPDSVRAVMRRYPAAAIVVPGHGRWGGRELLEHTIGVVSQR